MKFDMRGREEQRVRELVREYTKKGYVVIRPRSTTELPQFLRDRNYFPDLIATSAESNIVIEVRSKETSADLSRLLRVPELVNSQKGWQFILVLTNPRRPAGTSEDVHTAKVRELLDKSFALWAPDRAHREASFLFAWSALEASLRLLAQRQPGMKPTLNSQSLVRDAAMLGYIDRKDAKRLTRLHKKRNALLHAADDSPPTEEELSLVRRLAEANIDPHLFSPS